MGVSLFVKCVTMITKHFFLFIQLTFNFYYYRYHYISCTWKTPANHEICWGFHLFIRLRGWEKFHDEQTKGYMFGMW